MAKLNLTDNERLRLAKIKASPNFQELSQYLHMTDCMVAIDNWNDGWSMCPICGAGQDDDGIVSHRSKAESN